MRRNDIFIWEIYAKPPEKNHAVEKTEVFYTVDIWGKYFLDLNENCPKITKMLAIS